MNLEQCRENWQRRAVARYQAQEARRQQARLEAIAAITQVLPQYPQIDEIYLFGSVTRLGQFHQDSDVDIAVTGTDAASYFALWRDLEAACPQWFIDLREINEPSTFADLVRQTGELIYESSNFNPQSQPERGSGGN